MLPISTHGLRDQPPSREPQVSIVIPCYNQGRFLAAAIESALTQTYAAHEIIVVDDGSLDQTDEVAARYPGVRCIRQPNQGVASARNAGLRCSTGDYIVFIDADDLLLSHALEAGVSRLKACPDCAFVVGQCRRIDAEGRVLPPDSLPRPDPDFYAELLRHCFVWCPATVMYVRRILSAHGGFARLECTGTEDYELYLRLARTYPCLSHDHVVAEYRVHTDSMSRNAARMLRSTMFTLQAQRSYVANHPKYKHDLDLGIRAARRYYGPKILEHVVLQVRRKSPRCTLQELATAMCLLRSTFIPLAAKRALFSLRS